MRSLVEMKERLVSEDDLDVEEVIFWALHAATRVPVEEMHGSQQRFSELYGSPSALKRLVPRATVDQLLAEARDKPEAVLSALGVTDDLLSNFRNELLALNASTLEKVTRQQVAESSMPRVARVDLDQYLIAIGSRMHGVGFRDFALDGDDYKWLDKKLTRHEQLMIRDPSLAVQALGAAVWYGLGRPTVACHGHKYAAALMATKLPSDIDIRPPWPSFLVKMPVPLMQLSDGSGVRDDLSRILVMHYNHPALGYDVWSIMAMSAHGVVLSTKNRSTQDLLDADVANARSGETAAFEATETDEDGRIRTAISRLVLGLCLAMYGERGAEGEGSGNGRKRGGPLDLTKIVVGSPVSVDCREAVSDFICGRRRNPRFVQWLVRGHWRNQACGPEMTERRVMWIEPYWKGPEEAPILGRSYRVDERGAGVAAGRGRR